MTLRFLRLKMSPGSRHPLPHIRAAFQIIAILMLCSAQPTAAEVGPQELIQNTIEELRSAVSRDKQSIENDPNRAVDLVNSIVSPKVDTAKFGKLVLGKHWPSASSEQRSQFVDAYQRLLLRTYAVHASDYMDVKVEYLPLRSNGTDGTQATVRTVVSHDGKPPVSVSYRLYHGPDGQWRIYDVTADNISLVATFRATIDADIQQNGLDGMIANLQKKINQPLTKR